MQVSLMALAVQGALLAMCTMSAHAEEDEVAALTNPVNTIEIGATNVSRPSAKFGEYTGMNKSGVDTDLSLSMKGGDSYGQNAGIRRWSINGTDLGLTSRSAGASMSDQGKWNIGIGYDELRHNLSDTYKTPYLGAMGGNSFTLPAGFPLINTTASGTTPVGTNLAANMAAINAAFHPVDVSSTRKNGSVNAGFIFNDQWDVKFDYNHLEQSGAKLESFASMANATTTAASSILGQAVSILPSPTNYKTDTINLALNWKDDRSYVTTSYFGSFFKEGYDRVNFQTFGVGGAATGATTMESMSTAPSNEFHQLNVNGGYTLTPTTKLVGGLSYARNTQNDAFVDPNKNLTVGGVSQMLANAPQASLNGLVNNYHADLKLTDQTSKDLTLSAGLKFDERDDKTASNFYNFNAVDTGTGTQAYFPNTPYSNKKTQLELAGDYRLNKEQHLRFAYNHEEVKRWCNQYAVGGLPAGGTSTVPGVSSFPAGTNCVVATGSKDDKLGGSYKFKANDDLNLNVGYSYSDRVTTSDMNAITARISLNGNPSQAAANTATNIQGMNAGDFRGFFPFFDASRKEQMLKISANWQANEKWAIDAGMKYTDDKYPSTYGVTKGNSWSVNLDATYAYSENSSIVSYLTQQHRQRDLTDLQKSFTAAVTGTGATLNGASATAIAIPPGASWSDKETDNDITIGVGAKRKGLMDSKLELAGDLTYTMGRTGYGTTLNYATTTSTGGFTCASPQILSCGQLPDIQNKVVQFKLTGKYSVNKQSRVMMAYIYQQMKSTDFYYNGLQIGNTPSSLMPTNQQAPNYTVNVVTVAYIHDF